MGADASKNCKKQAVSADGHSQSRWRACLSNLGISPPVEPRKVRTEEQCMVQDQGAGQHQCPPAPSLGPKDPWMEWTLPGFISMFLPEFPLCSVLGKEEFQFLGYIAKGSFGPILKMKDKSKEKTYAVKVTLCLPLHAELHVSTHVFVVPKSEVLRLGILQQLKEEVIIQRQVRHAFLHHLQDCWQTQHHLFIMCDYCSTGDLYTYWVMIGQFGEDTVRVFAAELGCALGFLHNIGIIHRDVKMENVLLTDQGHLRLADFGLSRRMELGGRASTICGTIQYMAPEVLAGGPYSHAADWWSLGILIFAMVTGKFPMPPETDHCLMLHKVRTFPYEMPETISPPLALLLLELLCKTPARRLHTLERLQHQAFFRGTPFDPHLLQKSPMEVILELKQRSDREARACRGLDSEPFWDFDCELLGSPIMSSMDLSSDPTNSLAQEGSSEEVFV